MKLNIALAFGESIECSRDTLQAAIKLSRRRRVIEGSRRPRCDLVASAVVSKSYNWAPDCKRLYI